MPEHMVGSQRERNACLSNETEPVGFAEDRFGVQLEPIPDAHWCYFRSSEGAGRKRT